MQKLITLYKENTPKFVLFSIFTLLLTVFYAITAMAFTYIQYDDLQIDGRELIYNHSDMTEFNIYSANQYYQSFSSTDLLDYLMLANNTNSYANVIGFMANLSRHQTGTQTSAVYYGMVENYYSGIGCNGYGISDNRQSGTRYLIYFNSSCESRLITPIGDVMVNEPDWAIIKMYTINNRLIVSVNDIEKWNIETLINFTSRQKTFFRSANDNTFSDAIMVSKLYLLTNNSNLTFVYPTPQNDYYQENTSLFINVSCPFSTQNVSIYITNTSYNEIMILNNSPIGYVNASAYISDYGNYTYKAYCSLDISNSTVRNWVYTKSPNITINPLNFFTVLNTSTVDYRTYKNLLDVNVTIADRYNITRFIINITYPNGTGVWSYKNYTVGNDTYQYVNTTVNVSLWLNNQTYYIDIYASNIKNNVSSTNHQTYSWDYNIPPLIDNCTNIYDMPAKYKVNILNITFYDEDKNLINITYQATINYTVGTYSNSHLTTSKESYCGYPNGFNQTSHMQILYTDAAAIDYNYFLDSYLDNNTKFLNLSTLNGTTMVTFRVIDINTNPLKFYKIAILKYDVGTGTYITTELLQTDSQGYAIGNIILNTAYYNFIIYDTSNEIVYTENGVRLSTNTRTFTVSGQSIEWYNQFSISMGIVSSLIYNNATSNFVYTYSDPTGQMHYGCLKITKINRTTSEDLLDNCVMSSSATIVYNLATPEYDADYTAIGYIKFDNPFITAVLHKTFAAIPRLFSIDPMNSLFITLMLLIVGILIALPNPTISMLYFIVALIGSFAMGLYNISLTMLATIIILGFIITYIGGKQV